ncbi:MAG TPA: sugar transferase [Pseudonocardiaceae bacterium]|nr:sugar transferase [Pseudonocardiaceae bacterium]
MAPTTKPITRPPIAMPPGDPAAIAPIGAHLDPPPHAPARLRSPALGWERWYRRAVIASDLAAATAAALLTGLVLSRAIGGYAGIQTIGHAAATVFTIGSALVASRAWRPNVLGHGAEEFRRLGRGLMWGAVALALAVLAIGDHEGRPWVFLVVPTVAALAMPQRYLLRRWLHHARRQGRCLVPVIAAGSAETVADLVSRTRRAPHLGWRIEAACTAADLSGRVDGVPVIGSLGELATHVRRGGYRIVAVTADPFWRPDRLQRLAWELEDTDAELVVAPMLMDIAGPRLHVSGVLGMPLLRVSAPAFTGARRVAKEVMDRLAALLMLIALAPALLLIAGLIRADSHGPALYRQRRIGKDADGFTILKFRTMIVDADARRSELRSANQGAGPMFKLRRDPRITRVGVVLRRFSLDELPQLINVLTGRMSLVGPRPPLPEEIAAYGPEARRRLLVKPGMTGLWQVSGRSDLPWEETVRLDLRYVEDWSLALDALILWKTVRAVVRGRGAY